MGLNSQCCTQYDQTRYLISWHFSCQYHSSFAVKYTSVRILLHYKLLNYSVEGLKTRMAKWLPINKTLWNQITLTILSCSCHSSPRQVWISVGFASPQSWIGKLARGDNCKCQGSHLTTKCVDEMCHCLNILGLQEGSCCFFFTRLTTWDRINKIWFLKCLYVLAANHVFFHGGFDAALTHWSLLWGLQR